MLFVFLFVPIGRQNDVESAVCDVKNVVFQIFFSVTEAVSTVMVLHLANKDNKMDASKLLLILTINLMHVVIAGQCLRASAVAL